MYLFLGDVSFLSLAPLLCLSSLLSHKVIAETNAIKMSLQEWKGAV